MGNSQSGLSIQELNNLAANSGLSESELKTLHSNFQKFDTGNKGFVTREDILIKLSTKGSQDNALTQRIFEQFESFSKHKEIDFNKLITITNAFDANKKDAKLKFLFDMIDSDKDGLIGVKELEAGFSLVKLEKMSSQDLSEIAQQTLLYVDKDNDGFMNFEEFKEFYNSVLQISI